LGGERKLLPPISSLQLCDLGEILGLGQFLCQVEAGDYIPLGEINHCSIERCELRAVYGDVKPDRTLTPGEKTRRHAIAVRGTQLKGRVHPSSLMKEINMPTEAEIEAKFWKVLKSDRTMMLGLPSKASSPSIFFLRVQAG
jgi:hypothetical protein